jgi:hypothetical protein
MYWYINHRYMLMTMPDTSVITQCILVFFLGGGACRALYLAYRDRPLGKPRFDWLFHATDQRLVYAGLLLLVGCFLLVSLAMCLPENW